MGAGALVTEVLERCRAALVCIDFPRVGYSRRQNHRGPLDTLKNASREGMQLIHKNRTEGTGMPVKLLLLQFLS